MWSSNTVILGFGIIFLKKVVNQVSQQKLLFQKNLNSTEILVMFDVFNLSGLTCSVDQMAADSLDLLVHKLYVLSKNKNSVNTC